ncbi:MAG: hypothetical protein ABSA96_15570 [Candidatus Acidiferrales bacterium]
MKRPFVFWAGLFSMLVAGPGLLALDQISGAMKQILDHRGDDFASIRKDPQGSGDETVYSSTVLVPGAMKCYVALTAKPHYSNDCGVLETKNHAVLSAKYKNYVKALHEASPASWATWTKSTTKPAGEYTFTGPDKEHPAAAVHWALEGMNMDWYDLSVTFYAEGYPAENER